MTEDNSEYCRRPGVAISEASSNFEGGMNVLKQFKDKSYKSYSSSGARMQVIHSHLPTLTWAHKM
eukprot:2237150-Amphidinium_carterae.1